METNPCTESSWRLRAPPGLDVPGGNHSFSPPLIGLACVFSILNFSVTVMKKEKEKIETPVARDDVVSKDTP